MEKVEGMARQEVGMQGVEKQGEAVVGKVEEMVGHQVEVEGMEVGMEVEEKVEE